MRRSPPEHGMPLPFRAVMAASQSMAALGVPPLVPQVIEPGSEIATAQERAVADEQFGACFEGGRGRRHRPGGRQPGRQRAWRSPGAVRVAVAMSR